MLPLEPLTSPLPADYFAFLTDNDIRLKDTRIGIEHILYEYIHNAKTADEGSLVSLR